MQHTKPKPEPENKTEAQRERKQVGIHMDVELWRKFRGQAVEEGRLTGQLVEELIRNYLK